jgi:ribosomal protein S18 acetylase RimI-like enzyme
MDAADLLAAYDAQLREEAEAFRASSWQRHGPLVWACFGNQGFAGYRALDGADGPALDALIDATIAHFRDGTEVATVEWKTRGHDPAPELGTRLEARGFVAGELETVMVGKAQALAGDVPIPPEVTIRRAGDRLDLVTDVERASAMQANVFGRSPGPDPARVAAQLAADPRAYQMWLAEAGGQVVGVGTVDVVPGTQFAGLWGGAVLAQWRGRGIYRALVSVRARAAIAAGARYMYSDCTPMSRPILERSGLVAVTTTTPYEWRRDRGDGAGAAAWGAPA